MLGTHKSSRLTGHKPFNFTSTSFQSRPQADFKRSPRMNTSIAVGIGIFASSIASFLLFAIAFNTPFATLRLSFVPIYLGLTFVSLIASIIAPRRVIVILISTLLLPVLMLCYVASQRPGYFIDAIVLVVSSAIAAALASQVALRTKRSSPSDTKKTE